MIYNASARAHGPIAELDPEAVRKAVEISAFGGFLVVQQAARRMMPRGSGAILLTGASASVKGYPHSAAFAMGKFALRGLAQSTARELGPKGIHVAHFVIDGGVRSARRPDPNERPDSTLDPDAIAQTYLESCASRAAPGRLRSRCGRGWRPSDRGEEPPWKRETCRWRSSAPATISAPPSPGSSPRGFHRLCRPAERRKAGAAGR